MAVFKNGENARKQPKNFKKVSMSEVIDCKQMPDGQERSRRVLRYAQEKSRMEARSKIVKVRNVVVPD